jgi:integrase
LALQFIILTAVRTGEALRARWDDIDFGKRLWVIPAERMKAGKEHRVPLSDAALQVLSDVVDECRHDDEWVFPGQDDNGALSNTAVRQALAKACNVGGEDVTIHGFRSSFRDWASDVANAHNEVAEACLAHTNGDQTERAYRRSDALERRRDLMHKWGQWCCPSKPKVKRKANF